MEDLQQAHHELDRLQGIITRHEGQIFTLRSWLLATLGGLLAAYYAAGVTMTAPLLYGATLALTALFLFVESRHVILVEAVVDRSGVIEGQIADARRRLGAAMDSGWYDGPKVNEACGNAVNHWIPRTGMTFLLNTAFYVSVWVVVVGLVFLLPPRPAPPPARASGIPGVAERQEAALSCFRQAPPPGR